MDINKAIYNEKEKKTIFDKLDEIGITYYRVIQNDNIKYKDIQSVLDDINFILPNPNKRNLTKEEESIYKVASLLRRYECNANKISLNFETEVVAVNCAHCHTDLNSDFVNNRSQDFTSEKSVVLNDYKCPKCGSNTVRVKIDVENG